MITITCRKCGQSLEKYTYINSQDKENLKLSIIPGHICNSNDIENYRIEKINYYSSGHFVANNLIDL